MRRRGSIVQLLTLLVTVIAQDPCITPAKLVDNLEIASLSEVLALEGVNPISCSKIAMNGTWSGGKLLYSDSPETPTQSGILFLDSTLQPTTSPNRLFVYHANGKTQTMKVTVLIKNLGNSNAQLNILNTGIAGPSTDYTYIGKIAFERYLLSTQNKTISIAPNSVIEFDQSFSNYNIDEDQLLHGIWDYQITEDHEISVCFYPSNENPLTYCSSLSILTPDSTHQRGTFDYSDKIYNNTNTSPVMINNDFQYFSLACGTASSCTSGDEFITGFDYSSNPPTPQTLVGNYGILYRIHITIIQSANNSDVAFLVNPRGGTWGGAMEAEKGIQPPINDIYLIPPSNAVINVNTEAAVAGIYSVPNYPSSFVVWQQFMPTGGSAFPVLMLLVPFS